MKKLSEWPKDRRIVAVDFDGTITLGDFREWHDNECVPGSDKMFENTIVTDWIRKNRSHMYLVLWTCRCGESLERAITFCESIGILFDTINENVVAYESSNKIMADIYLDDKNLTIGELEKNETNNANSWMRW